MGIYRNSVAELRDSLSDYMSGEIDLGQLQNQIWSTADQILDVDEAAEREYLQHLEGQLELIAHTVSSAAVAEAIEGPLMGLAAWIAKYLS